MELFKRKRSDTWQCWCHYFDGTRRRRVARSTGITDDGTVKSRQTAEAVARDIERSLAVGGNAAARPSKTLRQALKALAESAVLAGRTRSTMDHIRYRGATLVTFFDINKPLADIDAGACKAFAVESRKTKTAWTVHRELNCLGQAFKAVGMKPPEFPELGEITHKPQRVLEVDEQRSLLFATPGKLKLYIVAYLQLGLRASEPWKITEVDWTNRYVFVNGTKTKGSKRWVPIPDELFAELLPLRASGWCGFEKKHQPNIDMTIKRAAKRAGIGADLSVNDLRGTYATHMARAGVPALTLAKIMGNSVKMLERVYANLGVRADHMHEAASKLPKLRNGATHVLSLDSKTSNLRQS
jgi:integrase